MTDQPGREPEQRLPARRPPSEAAPADRFAAPPQTRARSLSPERAAKIVRQSGNARWVAFLGLSVVAIFVIAYYFYETGAPLGLSTPRLDQQAAADQVVAVERGYNLYQANCARCHGANGEGALGPVLNDQMKLFAHLNPQYLRNVLTVGGRYVCGNPTSLMPVWSDVNGGPLNYRQIQELIAFLRAPSTEEFIVRNPDLNEPVIGADGKVETFKGWLDPAFKPAANATAVPACYKGDQPVGTQAPAESIPHDAIVIEITAEGIKYDKTAIEASAGKVFVIKFTNKDARVDHDVDIRTADGQTLVDNPVITGAGVTTYVIKALDAGTYTFICSVHPIPSMTGTLTIK